MSWTRADFEAMSLSDLQDEVMTLIQQSDGWDGHQSKALMDQIKLASEVLQVRCISLGDVWVLTPETQKQLQLVNEWRVLEDKIKNVQQFISDGRWSTGRRITTRMREAMMMLVSQYQERILEIQKQVPTRPGDAAEHQGGRTGSSCGMGPCDDLSCPPCGRDDALDKLRTLSDLLVQEGVTRGVPGVAALIQNLHILIESAWPVKGDQS
jgi:hypothetical protein